MHDFLATFWMYEDALHRLLSMVIKTCRPIRKKCQLGVSEVPLNFRGFFGDVVGPGIGKSCPCYGGNQSEFFMVRWASERQNPHRHA